MTSEEPENRIRIYKLLSFNVYGTLMDTPPASAKAFGRILADTGASNVDPATFGGFWEQRNIAHYYEPYRWYKEIGRLSLDEAFRHFGIAGGNPDSSGIISMLSPSCGPTQIRCRLSKSFRSVTASRWSQNSTMICSPRRQSHRPISSVRPSGRAGISLTEHCSAISSPMPASAFRKSSTRGSRSTPTWWAASR